MEKVKTLGRLHVRQPQREGRSSTFESLGTGWEETGERKDWGSGYGRLLRLCDKGKRGEGSVLYCLKTEGSARPSGLGESLRVLPGHRKKKAGSQNLPHHPHWAEGGGPSGEKEKTIKVSALQGHSLVKRKKT